METPPLTPTPNSLMGSRKETQKQTPDKQKQVSYRKTVICMKRKSHNNPQDYKGTTEIPTQSNLVRQVKIIKRRRTSFTPLSPTKNAQVSTELKLFDDAWPTANTPVAKE
ncbi:hypothetical protein Pint_17502 [Pistacia integerrima]|uniref:Uncharacterized protein n=1 Tax=Pistacia integerrima TaxID=434235 RepID=A0ACC0Z0M9_9ROSI|nr:hypothetical protein Pint_17502 [Pistacia integerrima]